MPRISITAGEVTLSAELNNSDTAARIAAALPIEATVNRWGDEIYFEIPVSATAQADTRQDVEIGDLAYWPPGKALCLFFGPTPVSQPGQCGWEGSGRSFSPARRAGRRPRDGHGRMSGRNGELWRWAPRRTAAAGRFRPRNSL